MKNNLFKIFSILILLGMAQSCSLIKKPFFIKNKKKEERKEKREEKKIEKDIAKGKIDSTVLVKKDSLSVFPEDTILARNIFKQRSINYKTFQAKTKMHYESQENKQNFTANFRMEKDKIIWVSISGFGIEVARAIITPDSVKAVERINKKSYLYSYNDIQKLINLEVDFKTLQELIIGNVIATEGVITEVKNVNDLITTFVKGDDFTNQITFSKLDTSLKQIQLQTQRTISTSSLLISMNNYAVENGIKFSTQRDYSIQDLKGAATLNMDINKFEFNKEMEFPFNIPANYERQQDTTRQQR